MKRVMAVLLAMLLTAAVCFAEDSVHEGKAGLLAVDETHARDGWVTVRKDDTDRDCRVLVNYGEISLQYDFDDRQVILPLQYGSGTYTVCLGVPLDGEREPGHVYKELQVLNAWDRDDPVPVITYDILDVYVLEAEIEDPYSCFLYPNCYVMYDEDSPWAQKAAELSAAQGNDMGKFSVITAYVCKNFVYDFIKSVSVDPNIMPDISQCWENRMGIAQDLAAMTCAMLRSQGIPAMLVYGRMENSYPHYWVTVNADGLLLSFDPTASLNAVSLLPGGFLRMVPVTAY